MATAELISSDTEENAREGVYQGLDSRINFLVDYWRITRKMPVVSWSGRKYLDDKDQLRFTGLFAKVATSYPDQTRLYSQYEELRIGVMTVNKFLKVQSGIGVRNAWVPITTLGDMQHSSDHATKWLSEFHYDPDFTFVAYLDRGITGVLSKRRAIRGLFRCLGKEAANGASYDQFFTGESKVLRGHIREVIPSRFSVNLVIDDPTFNQFQTKSGDEHPSAVMGCHINDSPTTFI